MKPKLARHIFFDLDDTLTGFDVVSAACWPKACAWFSQTFPCGLPPERVLEAVEKTREWYWSDPGRHTRGRKNLLSTRREIVRAALFSLGLSDTRQADALADYYSDLHHRSLFLFDGVHQALQTLRGWGVTLSVITNGRSQTQREKLARFQLTPYFDDIFISEEVGHEKPEPEIYRKALQACGHAPADVWMVGDHLVWDVQAPQQLGIFAVWNDVWQKGLPQDSPSRPDWTVLSVADMVEKLK